MSNYYLSPQTISQIYNETINNKEEICCFMDEKTSSFENTTEIFFNDLTCNEGTKVEYQYSETETRLRGTCKWKFTTQYPSFPKFIIHSHPITSKPYPSYEDLMKLFEFPQVRAQFISTRDGIWVLNLSREIRNHVKNLYIKEKRFNYDLFDKHHQKMFQITDYKIYKYFTENRERTIEENEINRLITNMNTQLHSNIKFYNWSKLIKEGLMLTFN